MRNHLCQSLMVILVINISILSSYAPAQQKQVEPRDADSYTNRGIAYVEKGQYDQAISEFNKALEINPKDTEAYYNRGLAYYDKGQYDKAISDYTKALEINPRDVEAHNNRGVAYGKKGQYDQAISDFTKAMEINPRQAEACYNRGRAYEKKRPIRSRHLRLHQGSGDQPKVFWGLQQPRTCLW